MSPRKSSTSSGRPHPRRPRYLGIEVAGEHFPSPSPREWERLISARLSGPEGPAGRFRLIRAEGRRAVVEFDHRDVLRARALLSAPPNNLTPVRPYRTWGTLVGAKAWLRGPVRGTER